MFIDERISYMRKNSRIISAAAAALLAVAPAVVSTGVVSAGNITIQPGQAAPAEAKVIDLGVKVSVNNLGSIKSGTSAAALDVTLSSLFGTPVAGGTAQVFEVDAKGNVSSTAAATLTAGHTYEVKVPSVYVNGLTYGASYSNNGKEYNKINSSSVNVGDITTQFTVPDTSLTGVPYFTSNGAYTTTGSVTLGAGENTVDKLAEKLSVYKATISGTAHLTKDENGKETGFTTTDLKNDIKAGLAAAKVTVDKNGNFTAPAAPFTVTINATATNGQTGSITVTVNAYNAPADYSKNPVITYNGVAYNHTQTISLASNASFNYIPVGSAVNTSAIAQAFIAVFSANSNTVKLPVSVDASKVNTAVAGSYPVTVTAKNANGYTTALTFNLTVGAKAPKTVQTTDGSAAPIYSFNGNSVSNTGRTVANGTSVSTFDTITVNGVSYTRINSATANEYVETKFVDGTQAEQGTTGPVMHQSIAYDHNGKSTGVVYNDYETITYVPKVVTINGKTYYKIVGKDQYVRVTNITGTPRRLTHNAYIYRTSTKRTSFNGKWKLYKGQSITTYGGSYRFKNGKTYFRIGGPAKQYIRVSNVR